MENRMASAVLTNIKTFGEVVADGKILLERIVKDLEKNDPDFLKENLSLISDLAKAAAGNANEIQTVTDALQNSEAQIRENIQAQLQGGATQSIGTAAIFEKEMQSIREKQANVDCDAFVRSIQSITEKVAASNSEEITVVQTEQQRVCPITKKPLVDPVRNKRCGHVYDREAVKSLMGSNFIMRCPVVGCGNSRMLNWNDLESHTELR